MTTSERSGGTSGAVAGIVTAIGGALLVIGTFLPFATVDAFGFSQSVTGMDTDSSWFYLGSGGVLLALGIVILMMRQAGIRRIVGVIGVIVAGLMTVVSIMDLMGLDDEIPAEAAGQLTVTAGIGLYMAIAGAIVGLIGSGMALFAKGEVSRRAAPPPPPPATTPTPPPPPAG